jgi:tetratricopeptide (TPR) repeat protein
MENKMAGKKKLETKNRKPKTDGFYSLSLYALGFALFVCTLLLSGCKPETEKVTTTNVDKTIKTSVEVKKEKLLKAIERRFDNPNAHFELGQLYQAEGNWAAAEYRYGIALRFDPVLRDAQAAMVKVLTERGDTAKAKLLADTYKKQVSSSSEWSFELAQAFLKQKLDEHALACYEQALHLEPTSAKVNKQLGFYYLSKNDKIRAREYLSRSFELNRNQPDVALALGQLGVEIRIPKEIEKDSK